MGSRRVTFLRRLPNVQFQSIVISILCSNSVPFDSLLHTLITYMHCQSITVCELCPTNVTYLQIISNMDTHMHLQSINVCKLRSTSITFERFLICVDAHMHLQRTTMRKPCPTNFTFVKFIIGVDTHMHLQSTIMCTQGFTSALSHHNHSAVLMSKCLPVKAILCRVSNCYECTCVSSSVVKWSPIMVHIHSFLA